MNSVRNSKTKNAEDAVEPVRVTRFSSMPESEFLNKTQFTLEQFGKRQDFQDRMLVHGYDENQILKLTTALSASTTSSAAYIEKRQEKMAKCKKLEIDFKAVKSRYSNLTARIRSLYGNDEEFLRELGLNKKREKTYAGFIPQGKLFYSVSVNKEAVRLKLEDIGIGVALLEAAKDEFEAFIVLWGECESLKGECQQFVEARDGNHKKLRQLTRAFIIACKHEFKDTPQALETLGIFVRNSKPKQTAGDTEPIDTDPVDPVDPVDPGAGDPGAGDPGAGDPNAGDPGAQEPATEQKTA